MSADLEAAVQALKRTVDMWEFIDPQIYSELQGKVQRTLAGAREVLAKHKPAKAGTPNAGGEKL